MKARKIIDNIFSIAVALCNLIIMLIFVHLNGYEFPFLTSYDGD